MLYYNLFIFIKFIGLNNPGILNMISLAQEYTLQSRTAFTQVTDKAHGHLVLSFKHIRNFNTCLTKYGLMSPFIKM